MTTCSWGDHPATGTALTADYRPKRVGACNKHGKRGSYIANPIVSAPRQIAALPIYDVGHNYPMHVVKAEDVEALMRETQGMVLIDAQTLETLITAAELRGLREPLESGSEARGLLRTAKKAREALS